VAQCDNVLPSIRSVCLSVVTLSRSIFHSRQVAVVFVAASASRLGFTELVTVLCHPGGSDCPSLGPSVPRSLGLDHRSPPTSMSGFSIGS
jgi:hypothetical protein